MKMVLRTVRLIAWRGAWESKRLVRTVGVLNVFSLGAIVVSLPLLYLGSHAQSQKIVVAQRLAEVERQNLANAVAPQTLPQNGVAEFYQRLPPFEAFPEHLQKLHEFAKSHGVVLLQGDYKVQVEPNAEIVRYKIVLPVRASFSAVNAFVSDALGGMPTLAVDTLSFRRERGDNGELEAMITLVLVLRQPPLREMR